MPPPSPPPAPEPLPPIGELNFRTSRASGPGGQHVNKTETRVEVLWHIAASPSLSESQRERITARLANRTDRDGRLVVACDSERSQLRNRNIAIERLQALVRAALVVPKRRKKRRVPRSVKERRLEKKRQQAQRKADRRRPEF